MCIASLAANLVKIVHRLRQSMREVQESLRLERVKTFALVE